MRSMSRIKPPPEPWLVRGTIAALIALLVFPSILTEESPAEVRDHEDRTLLRKETLIDRLLEEPAHLMDSNDNRDVFSSGHGEDGVRPDAHRDVNEANVANNLSLPQMPSTETEAVPNTAVDPKLSSGPLGDRLGKTHAFEDSTSTGLPLTESNLRLNEKQNTSNVIGSGSGSNIHGSDSSKPLVKQKSTKDGPESKEKQQNSVETASDVKERPLKSPTVPVEGNSGNNLLEQKRLEEEEDNSGFSFFGFISVSKWLIFGTFAAIAVVVGLAVAIFAVVSFYHKRYPVRMRFGRRFSTFENPIYRNQQSPGMTASKELRRLTGDNTHT